MTDLSPAMQMQCHRVSQKACDTIFGLLTDGWKMQESKTTKGVIENAMQVVADQAQDESLWFEAHHITEAILQKALRRLAAAVEGEMYYGQ